MARYCDAVALLACNDDCSWIDDEEPVPSAAAGIVASLFGKTDEEVRAHLIGFRMRHQRALERAKKSNKPPR